MEQPQDQDRQPFSIPVRIAIATVLILVGMQLVPYGRDHSNPPVVAEPDWDSPRTRKLFYQVCQDCHSNQTVWPWYSQIAPASWLIQHDVDEGRAELNVSEWQRRQPEAEEAAEMVEEKEMPPWFYLPLHPESRLSDQARQELADGLARTFGRE